MRVGCFPLARSGRVMHAGTVPAGLVAVGQCDCGYTLHARPGQQVETGKPARARRLTADELATLTADTVAQVHAARASGDRDGSDRALRHAVHEGVSPVVLLEAFLPGDQLVEAGQSSDPVRADVADGQLPSQPTKLDQGQGSVTEPPSDADQAAKPTPRRRSSKKAAATEDSSQGS